MKKTIATLAGLAPAIAFAAPLPGTKLVDAAGGYASIFTNFVNGVLVPTLFALIFVMFAWGVFKTWVLGAKDAKVKGEGGTIILNSIIGAVVILSFWGIVNFVTGGLGLGARELQTTPLVPGLEEGPPRF